jgi:hypothetical protein
MELSKEDQILIYDVLIKAKDQSTTAGFDLEKIIADSYGSSDMKYYDLLLRKLKDEMKHMGMPDRSNPAKIKDKY